MNAESNDPPIFLNPDDDAEMEAAWKRARQTFRYFWRELAWEYRRIIPGLDMACVKVMFRDPPEIDHGDDPSVEHMWISDVQFDGQHVTGTLINSPGWLQSVSEGDDVKVKPGQVSDWMYAIANQVYGGYTVQLLRSRMGGKERKQHDAAWGLDFGDPTMVRLVPPDSIGAAPVKSGMLSRFFPAKQIPQTVSEVSKFEHPMSENMGDSLAGSLKEDPSFLTATDDRGFTFLHQLALAGSAKGVAVMLKHGADPNAVAGNGMTAMRLAKSLGWKKVMALLESAGGK
ncbi:hypothetical protein K227x_55230 [Rubripirellula lacrimiformis]|uniref:DUF2314 domain-containing protein n=1 Tax=Rubripirellula lacrimiformis TaxID=1930273 RepID=A0A517NJ28_9BACT|nr:DUF2314 domain-containing protein [Rubripirellula lacrimiformis]QDT07098.1 hypothetical protein K227x_55230 [Rubripirellula lacrimiformis]